MSGRGPFPTGRVDWSGDNPGIYLKESEDGAFTGLVSYFRVALSPHGQGDGVVVLEAPYATESTPEARNVFISNNEPLARYLAKNFVAHFGAFRDLPGLQSIEYLALQSVSIHNDMPRSRGTEGRRNGGRIELERAG